MILSWSWGMWLIIAMAGKRNGVISRFPLRWKHLASDSPASPEKKGWRPELEQEASRRRCPCSGPCAFTSSVQLGEKTFTENSPASSRLSTGPRRPNLTPLGPPGWCRGRGQSAGLRAGPQSLFATWRPLQFSHLFRKEFLHWKI